MDDASGMGSVERVGDFDGQASSTSVSIGRPAMRCFSVIPSRNSMTMKASPCCSPISWMVQMLGWFNADAAFASR